MTRISFILAFGLLSATVASPGMAQEVTGELGSPGATTTIAGTQLPPPDPAFGGVIKEKATESTPWWPPRIVPPEGAPNILLIMTDDQGFGAPSTFGGVIPTPAMDALAAEGLRFTNVHSTAICSSTRAALITGRNHHSAGFGVVGEAATGFPGYDSIIRRENGTIGQILKDNGYATSWFGKNHNTPFYEATQAGPFDHWPIGYGFEYFYGFVGGDASQWQPNLFRNTTAIYPVRGQSRLEPDDRDGRRSHRLHDDAQGGRAGKAVLRLLRSRRHPCAAPPDRGMGQEDRGDAPVRRWLEQAARDDLRQPEAPRHHARDGQAD